MHSESCEIRTSFGQVKISVLNILNSTEKIIIMEPVYSFPSALTGAWGDGKGWDQLRNVLISQDVSFSHGC
jgi:hypothetical protein